MHTYTISGLNIKLEGYLDDYTGQQLQTYENHVEQVDIAVNCSLCDYCFSCGNADNTYGSGNEYWETANGHVMAYLFPNDENTFAVKIDFYNNGGNVDIFLFDLAKHLDVDVSHYLFNTLSFMFRYVVLYHRRLVLHSSSISCGGMGVAFSADSGVGKSTHTGLWMEHIPNCIYINDDTPVLYKKDDNIYICGAPFAGSSGINTNVTVPLKAIVFLERGTDNFIEKIDTQTAFGLVMGQVVEPIDRSLLNSTIDVISDILGCVPVYRLRCNISPQAALTAYNGIFAADD
ncbi:MAG: hypothetical protein IJ365_01405 [Clostridia bacterium]|nr:hypothetical protein [Clostridia bacterium]